MQSGEESSSYCSLSSSLIANLKLTGYSLVLVHYIHWCWEIVAD